MVASEIAEQLDKNERNVPDQAAPAPSRNVPIDDYDMVVLEFCCSIFDSVGASIIIVG